MSNKENNNDFLDVRAMHMQSVSNQSSQANAPPSEPESAPTTNQMHHSEMRLLPITNAPSDPASAPTTNQANAPPSDPASAPTTNQANAPLSDPASAPTTNQANAPSDPASAPTTNQANAPPSDPCKRAYSAICWERAGWHQYITTYAK